MNLKIRLLRKPFTTGLWLILVTAMTVLLCVGCALWFSSESAAAIIDDLHITAAYRTDLGVVRTPIEDGMRYEFESKTLAPDSKEFLESLDSVEAVYTNTLTGGYSPAFSPLCGSGVWHMVDESYDDVIVVATITAIEHPLPGTYSPQTYDLSPLDLGIVTSAYLEAQIHVEEYVCANEGYIGIGTPRETYEMNMSLGFLRQEDASFLEVGQRYLIRGTYFDSAPYDHFLDLDSDLLLEGNSLRGHGMLHYAQHTIGEELPEFPVIQSMDKLDLCLTKLDGTLEEFLADPANEEWLRILEMSDVAQHSVPLIGTESLESIYSFANNKSSIAEGRSFTAEEYASGARVCILSKAMAEQSGLQVGDTIPISQFWCVEEYRNSMSNYSTDLHPTDGMLNNPTVGHVGTDTEFITRDEEFTIVGIYRSSNEWDRGSYGLTPNTVFIPQSAQIPGGFGGFVTVDDVTYTNADGEEVTVTRGTEDATWGVYFSLRLRNGMTEEFKEAIAGTELENQFIITDQGYGSILYSIQGIAQSARSLLGLVAAGWALLLLLYILLYQGMQRRNIGIMRSLGAAPKIAGSYLFGSGMAVAATGVIIGACVSAGIMDAVQDLLYDAATYTVTLSRYSASGPTEQSFRGLLQQSQLPLWAIVLLAAAQLSIFALALSVQSRHLSRQEPRILLAK